MKIEKASFLDKISFYGTNLMVITSISFTFFFVYLALYNYFNLDVYTKGMLIVSIVWIFMIINYFNIKEIINNKDLFKEKISFFDITFFSIITLFTLYILYSGLTSDSDFFLSIVHLTEFSHIVWFLYTISFFLSIIGFILYFFIPVLYIISYFINFKAQYK